MSAGRVYLVAPKILPGAPVANVKALRLIRATHPSTALRHVAEATLAVRVATQDDLLAALGAGVKVEEVGAEAPAT